MSCSYWLAKAMKHSVIRPFAINKRPKEEEARLIAAPDPVQEFKVEDIPHTVVFAVFFFLGMGLSSGWCAVSMPLPFWIERYGPGVWPILYTAYNIPGLPMLFALMFIDPRMERRFEKRQCFIVRAFVALVCLFLVTLSVPLTQFLAYDPSAPSTGQWVLAGTCFVLGFFNALGYGWLFALAASFNHRCVASLLGGTGGAGLVVFAVNLSVPLLPGAREMEVTRYFLTCASMAIPSMVSVWVLYAHPLSHYYLTECSSSAEKHLSLNAEVKTQPSLPPYSQLAKSISGPVVAMALLNFSTATTVGAFTVLPSSSGSSHFPQVMAELAAVALFLGDELSTLPIPRPPPTMLFLMVGVRLLMMVAIFSYAVQRAFLNDYALCAVIFVYLCFGQFVVSQTYACAADKARGQKSTVSTMMSMSLYFGVYVGAGASYAIPAALDALKVAVYGDGGN